MNRQIVDKFILRCGIGPVVTDINIVDNNCQIALKGGYSMMLEVIDGILYKNGEAYCIANSLL